MSPYQTNYAAVKPGPTDLVPLSDPLNRNLKILPKKGMRIEFSVR